MPTTRTLADNDPCDSPDPPNNELHAPSFPSWLAPESAARTSAQRTLARSASENQFSTSSAADSLCVAPHAAVGQFTFEAFDPSYTAVALEVRHPYVDIRLLRFLLRVPALPWCRQKHLLRRALRGVLPDAVRVRAKKPLNRDPDSERVRRYGLPPALPSPWLETYGDAGRLSNLGTVNGEALHAVLRFVALSYWLHGKVGREDSDTGSGLQIQGNDVPPRLAM